MSNNKITIDLPYGKDTLTFTIDSKNYFELLSPNQITLPDSDEVEIAHALANPIGAPKISEMVNPDMKIALLCEDISRFAQTEKMMKQIVEQLNSAGVPDKNITVVFALGSHRPMTDDEMIVKIGRELFNRLKTVNSEFRDPEKLVDKGLAPGNVRIWLDPTVAACDFKIGIGGIVPHTAAGYTGGGKIIYPGVTGEATVSQFHLRSATLGNMTGKVENPARQAMEAWIEMVGLDYIVNAVVTPDNHMYKVVAGHYIKAHRKGVDFAREIYEISAKEKVDMLVVSSHSADLDLWQAGKGITNAETIVKDNGLLILVAPCPEGIGPHPSYVEHMASQKPESVLDRAHKEGVEPSELLPLAVGSAVAKILRRIRVAIVSKGIPHEVSRKANLIPFDSVEDALTFGYERYSKDTKVSVVTMGGDSFVTFKG
ncbi:MAG: nickel-dependent lactate racemase [Bacilli bacterium]|nr:nickel-dependent lactate racemase [Bacilli bacterium]